MAGIAVETVIVWLCVATSLAWGAGLAGLGIYCAVDAVKRRRAAAVPAREVSG